MALHKFKAAFARDVVTDQGVRYFKIRYCEVCKLAAPYGFTFEPVKERIIKAKDIKGWSYDYLGCRERKNEETANL